MAKVASPCETSHCRGYFFAPTFSSSDGWTTRNRDSTVPGCPPTAVMTAATKARCRVSIVTLPFGDGIVASTVTAYDPEVFLSADSNPRDWIGVEVESRLRRSGYRALRGVSCNVTAGTARLYGRLPSHYLKQIAQEVAGSVAGIDSIHNLIEVHVATDKPPARRGLNRITIQPD